MKKNDEFSKELEILQLTPEQQERLEIFKRYEEREIELYHSAASGEIASYDEFISRFNSIEDDYALEIGYYASIDSDFEERAEKARAKGTPLKEYALGFCEIYNCLIFAEADMNKLLPERDDDDSDPFWDDVLNRADED